MKVIYSKNALITLHEIIEFLEYRWTEKEIQNLNNDLEKLIESLRDKIISYPQIDSNANLRFAFIGKKQIKVFFETHNDSVEILLFWANKKDPKHLKFLLNLK
ncbi:hypothetical protein KSK37_00180 [Kaistella sp. DKR-2]|uniref:type II toxin-antitoxin system RelE/ParE family toxin n=1 Tax=Kaistella soli TaxID=2849654 RepID=UPI001C27D414|nr:hypothetical protein [Kaistella soli]MBU8881491.1 hypothetical protein [Kaistella soli]